ncbi:hypothetical protein [Synechococcus sp. MIT S9508]|uniref:hypothetical protein n=1 Tax=Synechococcus sp. MIT S9508 TaxID=1801629 RepID=UPI0007BB00C4|nr:hypothetical protein [Synechococcus sp. MIT S9508]KZR91208.1 hypothetical protein MITS9508_00446 [Synechococcus sp. MIT S9508]
MGSASCSESTSSSRSINSCAEDFCGEDLVCVQFWMNGCSQVAHVSRSALGRYRRDLLATGAVLLN